MASVDTNGVNEEVSVTKKEVAGSPASQNNGVAAVVISIRPLPKSHQQMERQVQLKLHRLNEDKLNAYLSIRAEQESVLSLRYQLLLLEADELSYASRRNKSVFDGSRVNLLPEMDSSQVAVSPTQMDRTRPMPKSAAARAAKAKPVKITKAKSRKKVKVDWSDDEYLPEFCVPDITDDEDNVKPLFPFGGGDTLGAGEPRIKLEVDEQAHFNGDAAAAVPSIKPATIVIGGPKKRRGRPRKKFPSGDTYAYFPCDYCSFLAATNELLDAHTKDLHSFIEEVPKIKAEVVNDDWEGFGYDTSFLDSHGDDSYSPQPKRRKKHPFACNLCSYKADSQSSLDNHKDAKHSAKPAVIEYIKCTYCEQDIDRTRMDQHMFAKHKDIKLHICDRCPFKSNSLPNLTRHINNMHLAINNWPCPECPLQCGSPHALKKHVDRIHKNIQNFMCELCSYRSATGSELRTHMEMKHTATDRYKCDKCEFATALKRNLERHHIRVHSLVKGFSCPMQSCGYQANEKGDIDKHVKRVHMGMRRYHCHITKCEFKIDSKGKWLEHLAIEHRLTQSEIDDISLKRKRTRIGGAHRKAVLLLSSPLGQAQSPPFPSVVPRPPSLPSSSN